MTATLPGRTLRAGSLLLAGSVLLPLLVIFSGWAAPAGEVWSHLAGTVLGRLLANTLILMLGVAAGTALLGVGLAWLVSAYDFPGRKLFNWALMLPFALPTYVMAFVFLGLLDFQGPAQELARRWLDLPASAWIDVRGPAGVLAVMTLVLYPYVYLLARVAFLGQGQAAFEAARTLGMSAAGAFFRAALPLARPAVAAGVSLAVLEALADFGAVAAFNFDTFTTAIYKAWFGMFDLRAASQLASLLLLFALALLTLERYSRARARYAERGRPARRRRLRGGQAAAATGGCAAVLLLAFLAPLAQLLVWAWDSRADLDAGYLELLGNTLGLGAAAALATVLGAVLLAVTVRHRPGRLSRAAARVGTLGYAIPGSVLAVAVMLSLGWIDRQLAAGWLWWRGEALEWALVGSAFSLILAYFARFLALAHGPVDAAFEQLRASVREAAQALGLSGLALFRRVYLPLLRPGLLTAALLVLVDVMKELPATLLLRPLGWDTLAVRVYGLTAEGLWERAALPAVALVAAGLLPVLLLNARRAERRGRHGPA